MSLINKNITYYLIILFILLFSFFLRFSYYDDGLWSDEWISFLFSNPDVSFYKNLVNHLAFEGAPPIILLSNIFWSKIFGYYYQSIELSSIFFSFASILVLFFFFKMERQHKLLFLFLVSVNPFLIYYAGEVRFYSASVFFGLLSISSFLYIQSNKKLFIIFLFFFTTLISLLINLYFISVFVSYFFFCLFKKKNFFVYFFLIFIFFLILNYYYLVNIFTAYHNSGAGGSINFKFFLGYFFNIFFADKILGFFFLFLIILCSFFYRNEIKKDNQLLLFILIVFFSYLIPIIYAIFFNSVTHPRHLINVVIPLIYLISSFILRINIKLNFKILIIFITIIYSIFLNFKDTKPYISKPNPNNLLKHIYESKINFLYVPDYIYNFNLNFSQNLLTTTEQIYAMYNYFFLYSKNFNNNIYVLNDKNYLQYKFFWVLCLNRPSFSINYATSDSKCLNNKFFKNYKKIKLIEEPGFILIQFKRND